MNSTRDTRVPAGGSLHLMVTVRADSDDSGIAVISAAARAAVAASGGNGDAAAMALQLAAMDARRRSNALADSVELELIVTDDGTEVRLTLRDHGEPLSGPAAALAPLLELELMSSSSARVDGQSNLTEMWFPKPSHGVTLDESEIELVSEDAELSSEEVELRELRPSDAAALTRSIYRSYGWTYPHPDLYYPEQVAASIESGRRVGEVAVTADGEVVAHWGAIYLTNRVVESGLAITDPRFRRRGIAGQLLGRLEVRLQASHAFGRVGEPVLTHTATQDMALKAGGAIVGAYLSYGVPVAQVGITEGMLRGRRSLTVAYFNLAPLAEETLYIPRPYEAIAQAVIANTTWPRIIGSPQRVQDTPDESVIATKFDSFNRRGEIDVKVLGRDLVDVVDQAMESVRRSGAEVIHVRLPVNDPALSVLGEGLTELGLAYAAIFPEFTDEGDALVLQWLADPDVETSAWHYANDDVEALVMAILSQIRELNERGAEQRRRAARRATLFAALER